MKVKSADDFQHQLQHFDVLLSSAAADWRFLSAQRSHPWWILTDWSTGNEKRIVLISPPTNSKIIDRKNIRLQLYHSLSFTMLKKWPLQSPVFLLGQTWSAWWHSLASLLEVKQPWGDNWLWLWEPGALAFSWSSKLAWISFGLRSKGWNWLTPTAWTTMIYYVQKCYFILIFWIFMIRWPGFGLNDTRKRLQLEVRLLVITEERRLQDGEVESFLLTVHQIDKLLCFVTCKRMDPYK